MNILEAEIQDSVVEGKDKITKFFHRTANAHSRNNFIERMIDGESNLETQEEIQEWEVNFYKGLYSE